MYPNHSGFHCFVLGKFKLGVRFFENIQDWILKSERIRKRIFRFFTKQINPRSLGSWCVKETEESTLGKDFSVPLIHSDPGDLGLICLVKKRKIRFRIKNSILDFLKEMNPRNLVVHWANEISLSWHVAFQTEICYSTIETHRFIRMFKIIVKIIQIGGPQFVFK